MAPRFVSLTAVLVLFGVSIGSAQTTQLPKTVSLAVVEKDAMPHKLVYKSEIQIFEAQGRTVNVTSHMDGRATIVLTDGTLAVSTPDRSRTKKDVFSRLDLGFASNGDMIEFKVTHRADSHTSRNPR